MNSEEFRYIDNIFDYKRQATSLVKVGYIEIGGENPIRLQSMTDTDTNDTEATVNQIVKIIEAGADIVRLTVQGVREAENLKYIRQSLDQQGYNTPLVADIHFNPEAAKIAMKYVQKIRINPGNFYDKRAVFEKVEFTNDEYAEELKRIENQFVPFLKECELHGVAIRIGANHGSLSDRILSRYGDTPTGIVESVMEYLRICEAQNFHNIVISIKSSNTRTMVYTTRLMNQQMRLAGMNFPLHIGVTEAGEGEDGRVKSAVGSGALLADGIGDTIRVSLTENPANEIPFARKLVEMFENRKNQDPISAPISAQTNPFEFNRRSTISVDCVGGTNPPIVIANIENLTLDEINIIESGAKPEFYYTEDQIFDSKEKPYLIQSLHEFLNIELNNNQITFVKINKPEFDNLKNNNPESIEKIRKSKNLIFILESKNQNSFAEMRAFFLELNANECKNPVVVHRQYSTNDYEQLLLQASTDFGAIFIDGYADGIMLSNNGNIDYNDLKSLSFSILQASRSRISKTEFISCPGCGRTLFDLQETVAKVKKNFDHLKNLKIGVMGCIVNGPGEMGDVDYGYVGAGKGKINLYKGKSLVKRNVNSADAVEELKNLITQFGDWRDVQLK